ncbi:MAG: ABC transporter ATP-binding protein [Proteobacteria bacterium]|nr:ABC transporter ATP-binding protein [Pseudomonadota bacterium]
MSGFGSTRLPSSRAHLGGASVQYAIDIVDLEKSFTRQTLQRGSYTTLKSSLFSLLQNGASRPKAAVTRAVSGLTIRIPQGSSVGVIGRNGSGKSTLLKLITGIYKPTKGKVAVNGRVAALIELGAGFHPDFTGRENLYLAGIMMGLTRREIAARFDEIVDFAGLREVIDDPVRTYSSGMFMRLGFSVAVHTDPDVLLIDEVLAVGDAAFVRKSKERVSELRKAGKTLLLVSHDLEAVERWCDEVIWLHQGEVRDRGEPRRVIDHYREFLERGEEEELLEDTKADTSAASLQHTQEGTVASSDSPSTDSPQRWGSREIQICSVRLLNSRGEEHLLFHSEDSVEVEIRFAVHDRNALKTPVDRAQEEDVAFGIGIQRNDGVMVHGTNTDIEGLQLPRLPDSGVIRYRIERLGLLEGSYLLDVAVHRFDGYPIDYHKGCIRFAVRSQGRQVGVMLPPRSWSMPETIVAGTGSEPATAWSRSP